MICHIDGFTYIKDWNEAVKNRIQTIQLTQEECDEDEYEEKEDFEDITDEEAEQLFSVQYVYFTPDTLPSFYDFIEEIKNNCDNLCILWFSEDDGSNPQYIAKGSVEYLLGILDGVNVAAVFTGVKHSLFEHSKDIKYGLLAADNYIQINNFFNTEVFF